MAFAVLAALLLILCAATKKWKHWKEYYSTILYLYIGDLTALLLFKKRMVGDVLFNISYCMFRTAWLYTGTVILFLSYYPFAVIKRLSYFLFGLRVYCDGLIAYLTGDFYIFTDGIFSYRFYSM